MSYSQIWAITFFSMIFLTMVRVINMEGNVLLGWIFFSGIFAYPIWLIVGI